MIIQLVLNTEHIMNHDHIGTYRDKHNVNELSKAHVWLENILPPFEEPLFGRLKLSIVSPATCHIKKCQKKDKQTMCIIVHIYIYTYIKHILKNMAAEELAFDIKPSRCKRIMAELSAQEQP